MSKGIRSALGVVGLVFGSVLVAMLAGEGILRAFPSLLSQNAQIRLHWEHGSGPPPSPHRYIGFVPHPAGFPVGTDATGASAEQIWGSRNRPPWPKTADVVAVGDSFTWSQTVDLDHAWTTLLDDSLPSIRVITLGIPGAGPQQYLRTLETYGLGLSPKLVLVGLFMGNDITDAEIFDRWWRDHRDQDFRYFRSGVSATGLNAWIERLSEKSYLAWALEEARREHHDRFLLGETINLPSGQRVQIVPNFLINNVKRAVPGNRSFDLVFDSLNRLKELAASHGAACLVLMFPSKEEVYGQFASRKLPDLEGPTIKQLDRYGIAYLNLGPVFRERARHSKALYHEVDGHPTALGYALIADTVRQYLVKNASKYGLNLKEAGAAAPSHAAVNARSARADHRP